MNEATILSVLFLVAGIYFSVRNVRMLRNETALREYMQSSPKATLWVRKFGLDGATRLARKFFLPSGLLISVAMAGVGAWNLWRMYI